MRIGELARQSGVPATALRYYEQLGLLPEPGRTDAGYRIYAADSVDRLAFIRAAQAVGLTLAEVRQVLGVRDTGEAPCRVVTDLIDHRHAEVKSKIAELRRLESELAVLRARAARLHPRDCDPSGICHVIPAVGNRGSTSVSS
jgi:MerR family transcriptional regulator, copper efflux regulator